MQYKFLADENIPLKFVTTLKQKGYDVLRIDEVKKGMNDKEVINLAKIEDRILLTFDKDFGYITFKTHNFKPGIILFRFSPVSIDKIVQKFELTLSKFENLKKKFIVIEEDKIRVREIKD